MKDIENIEDWYREELNNYDVEPDATVWDSLSEDLDTSTPLTDENISEWYKKEVTKLEERPDYTVWEKLSTRLDTASVWDKLVVSLNRYDQLIWWRNVAFRGTAVFLLVFGSYLAYDNYTEKNNESATNTSNAIVSNDNHKNTSLQRKNNVVLHKQNESSKTTYEAAFSNASNTNNKKSNNSLTTNIQNNRTDVALKNVNNTISKKENITSAINEVKKNTSTTMVKKRGRSKENTAYASMNKIQQYYHSISVENLNSLKTDEGNRTINTDIDRHQLTERDISHLYADGDFLVKKDNNKIVFNSKRFSSYFMFGLYARRIYAGFNAGFKKQGMITKIKENSVLSEYKQDDFLDFGSNFGGTVGFIVSDNFNLEANVNFNSTAGYKRGYTAEGISYKEDLNLNYTSLSVLAKKMNNKSTFDNKVYSTNLIGGIYASYLTSSVSDVNGVTRDLDEYNTTDFGIVLGIEQDRYITKTLVITPGIRYNQGLTNNANDNSPFESSRNFSFEFNLGVKYIFLKKGK